MSSTLLNCTICPKKPNFSDTSHLLTHVSSKGHLSHLHKLQVLSHQEVQAGQKLAIYNSWYHANSIGQLLSDRLLQKQSKKAKSRTKSFPTHATGQNRRPRNLLRTATTGTFDLESSTLSDRVSISGSVAGSSDYLGRSQRLSASLSTSVSIKSDDDEEYDSSPTNRYGRQRSRKTRLMLSRIAGEESDDELAADMDPFSVWEEEDDHNRLKGVLWPGMSIFDAAPEEMKRKRNQKKDGSLLKQMEKTSEVVEPSEVIFTPQGALAKIRQITGMVDDSSPLPGETPIPKKKLSRPKRPALAPIDKNLPRRPKRESRAAKRISGRVNDPFTHDGRRSLRRDYPSSRQSPFNPSSHFSPTEDENREFRLTVGGLRPKSGAYAVYKEQRALQHTVPRLPQQSSDGLSDYRMPSLSYSPGHANKPELSLLNMPAWLRPPQSESRSYGIFSPEKPETTRAHLTSMYDNGIGRSYGDQLSNQYQMSMSHGTFGWDGAPSPVYEYGTTRTTQAARPVTTATYSSLPTAQDGNGYGINPLSLAFQQLQQPIDHMAAAQGAQERLSPQHGLIESPNGTLTDPGIDFQC